MSPLFTHLQNVRATLLALQRLNSFELVATKDARFNATVDLGLAEIDAAAKLLPLANLAPTDHEKAFQLIQQEMDRQDAKWGAQRDHEQFKWVAILTEETGEVAEAALDESYMSQEKLLASYNYLKELIHVAAVATQAMEARMRVTARLQQTEDAKVYAAAP